MASATKNYHFYEIEGLQKTLNSMFQSIYTMLVLENSFEIHIYHVCYIIFLTPLSGQSLIRISLDPNWFGLSALDCTYERLTMQVLRTATHRWR